LTNHHQVLGALNLIPKASFKKSILAHRPLSRPSLSLKLNIFWHCQLLGAFFYYERHLVWDLLSFKKETAFISFFYHRAAIFTVRKIRKRIVGISSIVLGRFYCTY